MLSHKSETYWVTSNSSNLLVVPGEGRSPEVQWAPPCICIDIETPASNEAILHKIAAFRPDTGDSITFQGKFSPAELRAKLDALAAGAEFVLGHNIKRHDIPVLTQLYPELALSHLPLVDTLNFHPSLFQRTPIIVWSRITSWSAMREITRYVMRN